MNIWILHPSAGGPGAGRHWRPYWLAEAWNRMGHRAIVVCATFHHLMQGEPKAPREARIGDVDYWFVKTPSYRGNGFGRLRNNFAYGRQVASDADALVRKFGGPDLIIASIPHLFHVPVARRIARRFGAEFWVEVRDLWPESIVALGVAARWHPLVLLIARQERGAYRNAERVISLLAGAEPHMQRRGLPSDRFLWIPNGVSEGEMRQAAQPPAIEHSALQRIADLRARGKQIVIHAGAMGPANAVEIILDAARRLAQANSRVHFILAGGGVDRERYQAGAGSLENLDFFGEVERPIAHGLLRASDCAVIAVHRNALYDYGISPNKLFDHCLFAPRSVIACDSKALAGLEGLAGGRCEPDDPDALVAALTAALAAPARPLDERIAALGKFSYVLLAERYLAGIRGSKGGDS
jgi:glycosyltransferase involved in cell wall biosynthesis